MLIFSPFSSSTLLHFCNSSSTSTLDSAHRARSPAHANCVKDIMFAPFIGIHMCSLDERDIPSKLGFPLQLCCIKT